MQNIINLLKLAHGRDGNIIFLIIIGVTFIFSMLTKKFFTNLLIAAFHKLLNKTTIDADVSELRPASKALSLIFVASLTYAATLLLTYIISEGDRTFVIFLTLAQRIYRLIMIFAVTVLIYALTPFLLSVFQKLGKKRTSVNNPYVDVFIERVLRFIVIAIGIVALLSELNINVNGLITGIGLGGLTFALAAQDTASNIFGGLVIISDRPFVVGDWISTDELEGIVEDISFRSTRIRTFDDALVIVPNSKLSSVVITNWSKMTKRRVNFKVGLSYETDDSKLQQILEELRAVLSQKNLIEKDSIVVRLDELSLTALNLRIVFYAKVKSFAELKSLQEEVNFDIIRIVRKHAAGFANSKAVSIG